MIAELQNEALEAQKRRIVAASTFHAMPAPDRIRAIAAALEINIADVLGKIAAGNKAIANLMSSERRP
jgi:hypothetical protein